MHAKSHELHESILSAVYVHVKQNDSQSLKTASSLLFALRELYDSYIQKKKAIFLPPNSLGHMATELSSETIWKFI